MDGSSSNEKGTRDDSNHPDNKPLQHEGWTSIKEKKRHCTDILFLLILICSWIAMTAIGFAACGIISSDLIVAGDVSQLRYSTDYAGRLCGVSDGLHKRRYGYYLLDASVVCVSSCPSSTDFNAVICEDEVQTSANSNLALRIKYLQDRRCMFKIDSYTILNRCIPKESLSTVESMLQGYNITTSYAVSSSTGSWFKTFLSDVYEYRGIIFGFGIGVSTAIAFTYLYFLRIPGVLYIIIWGIIFTIQLCLMVGTTLLWILANKWKSDGNHTSYQILAMRVVAYFGVACTLLYFCLILVIRKRIQLAIGIVKESARALSTLPLLILMPIFQVVGIVMFLVPWIIFVIYLASSGDTSTVTKSYTLNGSKLTYKYKTYSYARNTKYAFLYMIFCFFWTSEFIVAVGQLVISLSVVAWYFTRDKKEIGNHTILWSFRTVSIYHLGTAAFGSLIIGTILTIRAVVAYAQKKMNKPGNFLIKYFLCVLQCFTWCLEKFMRFINKSAYIQTSLYSYSFCKAARCAFFLILRNILRVAAVNMIADFILFLGKVSCKYLTHVKIS